MTLNELIEEVYLTTGRRDLVAETKSAVKAATLKAHNSDFYSKDLYESGVEFPSASYKQSLDVYSLIPNFRAISYLRKAANADDVVMPILEVIEPQEVLDSYQRNRNDIAYVAGRIIEIRSSTEFQYALLGAYVTPPVSDATYSSWVAILHPYAIIYEAARVVFRSIGNAEESQAYSRLLAEEYSLLKMTGLANIAS